MLKKKVLKSKVAASKTGSVPARVPAKPTMQASESFSQQNVAKKGEKGAPVFQVTSQTAVAGQEKAPKMLKKPSMGTKSETGATK